MEDKTFELMEKMYAEMQTIKTDLQEVKTEVKQNSNHILRLENKMDEKLLALFDANTQMNQKLNDVTSGVEKISDDVSSIELITSKNWHDVAALKKVR